MLSYNYDDCRVNEKSSKSASRDLRSLSIHPHFTYKVLLKCIPLSVQIVP